MELFEISAEYDHDQLIIQVRDRAVMLGDNFCVSKQAVFSIR